MPQPFIPDTDLVIFGGGPAGCAAAVMAAGLGPHSALVEPKALGHTPHRIPALDNVLGFASGPGYADDHVEVHLAGSDRTVTGQFAVVATGQRPAPAGWQPCTPTTPPAPGAADHGRSAPGHLRSAPGPPARSSRGDPAGGNPDAPVGWRGGGSGPTMAA